jgi:hypothetical protein
MLALLVACVLGQASSDPVFSQRTWLFASLKSDLEAKGQTDPAQLQQAREQIGRLTPDELQTLVNLYQRLKQGATPDQIYTDAVVDRDQSVVVRDQLQLELDLRSHLPATALYGGNSYGSAGYPDGGYPGAGYPGGSYFGGGYSGFTYGSGPFPGMALVGNALYGGLPAPNMLPGSYAGNPLPFAGPVGFGTFTATGPVTGYSAPFVPGGPPNSPMPLGY